MRVNPVLLFLVAIVATGLGIYVIYGGAGNDPVVTATNTGGAESCAGSVARGQKLDPVATGDVAAFRAVDEPLNVSFLSFRDADGNSRTLADWKGRTVLFNLWATWCVPCREEMPALDALEKEKGSEKFQVVPVSIDLNSDEKPKAFYSETGLATLPFFHDGSMVVFQQLKERGMAFGMPTSLLVDFNGCVLGVLGGPADWASDDAFRLIDAAITS